jgi:hypothetical protein
VALRKGVLDWAVACFFVLISLCWCLWFTGPIAKSEIDEKGISSQMNQALAIVGNRETLLYLPTDGLRGYAGFYGRGVVKEVILPSDVVILLEKNKDKAVILSFSSDKNIIPTDLTYAATNTGSSLKIEAAVDFGNKFLLIISLLS